MILRRIESMGQLAVELTNARRFVRWKLHTFNGEKRLSKSDCTNRTSLRKLFYAMDYSLYTQTGEATGRRKKVTDSKRTRERGTHGCIWKSLENARSIHR